MRAAMCFRSATCSTRWRRASCRFRARRWRPSSRGMLTKQPAAPSALKADVPRRARSHHRQGAREGSGDAVSERSRNACRSQTPAPRNRDRPHERLRDAVVDAAAVGAAPQPAPARKAGRYCSSARRWRRLAVMVGVVLWQSHRTPALRMRDTVVLVDVRQSHRRHDVRRHAGRGARRCSCASRLTSSVVPEQQVQSTLRLMGRRRR